MFHVKQFRGVIMTAADAMKIGEHIADRYAQGIRDMLSVKPDATVEQLVRGNHVWLSAEIMVAVCAAALSGGPE